MFPEGGQAVVGIAYGDESTYVLLSGGADRPNSPLHPQVIHPHHCPIAAYNRT